MNRLATKQNGALAPKLLSRVFAVVLLLIGGTLGYGGARLLGLGGSPYYLLAGFGLVVSAIQIWRNRVIGVWLLIAVFFATIPWALWESGLHFWALFPRLFAPAVIALFGLLLVPSLIRDHADGGLRTVSRVGAAALTLGLAATLWLAFQPHGVLVGPSSEAMPNGATMPAGATDWTHYGRTPAGTRFAPFDQITPENVTQLEVAWIFNSGDIAPGDDQNVPLQVGDTLFTCSRNNKVAALDADTGEVRWRFDPKIEMPIWQRCRGLGYHDDRTASGASCSRRIIMNTLDGRLYALDAATGALCGGFGQGGFVSLAEGIGEYKPGFYVQTSAPAVTDKLIVVGGRVLDNEYRGEPSGVIRAFDVTTGALVWAWDLGNPAITREPPPGETFTPGTPNMWSTASFDEDLGLIYLPMGNETPDFYGEGRMDASEVYASSVVALELASGKVRWHYQMTHHDIWDYDIPSQPAIVDLPDGAGGTIPALLVSTKQGMIFLLNRETGEPVADVEERPVPQSGAVPGEVLAETQRFSVGMPSIGSETLTEAQMWGTTPLDQLYCRIKFKSLLHEGLYTPPSLQGTLQYPGNGGGMNWGSLAVDTNSHLAYVNDMRIPVVITLMPRDEADAMIAALGGERGYGHGPALQEGTPYGVNIEMFMSPLGIPCNQPPYGTVTAVDLVSKQIAWQVPMGTVQDTGPLGIATHLPMPVGMPTVGGPLATSSGLIFFAGTQDYYIRALDSATGEELWRGRLPVGSGSTPMSYVSPKTGKQYIVISAGGARGASVRSDEVIAYALPDISD